MKNLTRGSLLSLILLTAAQAQVTSTTVDEFLALPPADVKWELICSVELPNIVSLGMSAQRQFIATGTEDGICQVWNATTGDKLGEFQNAGRADCVAVSPDGKFAAVGGRFKSLRIWDVSTGKLAHENPQIQGGLSRLSFSRDGEWIYFRGSDGGLGRVPKLGGRGRVVGFGRPVPAWHMLDRDTKIVAGLGNSMLLVRLPRDDEPGIVPLSGKIARPEIATAGNRLIASANADKNIYLFNVNEDFTKPTAVNAYRHNLSQVDAMAIDPKDSFVLLIRRDGAVELKAVASRAIWRVRLPIEFSAQQIVIGDDGFTTCVAESKGFRVWKPTEPPLKREIERDRLLAELLKAKDYKNASRLLNGLVEKDRIAAEDVSGILSPKTVNGKRFDDWAARMEDWSDKDSSAVFPRLALSDGYRARAWHERGTGPASTVSRDKFKSFQKYLRDAEARLEECQLTPELAESILTSRATLAVAMTASRADAESIYKLIMKHVPQSRKAHGALVPFYQQRWHGKAGECEKYASKVAKNVGGQDGEKMYALIAYSLQPTYEVDDFFTRTQFDADRIIKASDNEIARAKTDRDKHFWLLLKLTWVRRAGNQQATHEAIANVLSTKAYQSFASDEHFTAEYHSAGEWLRLRGVDKLSEPKSK